MRRQMCGPLLVNEVGLFLSFRKGVKRMGLVAKDFSSHSFQIGVVMSPEAVKRIGRWESELYRIYVCLHLL